MSRLIIWRHGQTDWNAVARFQGQADSDLDEVGRAQAATAAEALAGFAPDAIVCSDLRRASDTAAALAAVTGLPAQPDERLRERHFGLWQGMLREEIAEKYPVEFTNWLKGDPDPGCGLEPQGAVAARVGAALIDAVERVPDGTVVAVTHGGAASNGIGHLLGWSSQQVRQLRGMANCHWAEMYRNPVQGWVLRSYNVGVL